MHIAIGVSNTIVSANTDVPLYTLSDRSASQTHSFESPSLFKSPSRTNEVLVFKPASGSFQACSQGLFASPFGAAAATVAVLAAIAPIPGAVEAELRVAEAGRDGESDISNDRQWQFF